jgi:Fe-S cluster assembly protein SufD
LKIENDKLKFVSNVFHCEVEGLDTEKVYMMNGGKPGNYTLLSQDKPLQLISVREGTEAREVRFENNFTIPAGSSAKIIICDHTASHHPFITQSINNICLKEGARLEMLFMQNEHNHSEHHTTTTIEQGRNSYLSCTVATLYGGVVDNSFEVKLTGEGAVCELNGLYLSDREQRVTNTARIHHLAGRCLSRQLFKGILDEQAVGVFNGHILVDKGAQKTEAYQVNHNLLLTHTAKMFTQPHLEIYADDVKCSHGATIGRIDENALFYLRSRGVSLPEARHLQQFAFANDVLEKITVLPLRERTSSLVEKRLRGELLPCADCSCHCC